MIYLETDRLILRDYTIDDFEAYYKLKADPQTMYYLQDIQLHSFDEARSDFEHTSEALKKVLEYAYTENNVYRVTTGCLAENKGSERVMQKNGLIKEAQHIDYEWHDGKLKDRLEYRLLRKEWERL